MSVEVIGTKNFDERLIKSLVKQHEQFYTRLNHYFDSENSMQFDLVICGTLIKELLRTSELALYTIIQNKTFKHDNLENFAVDLKVLHGQLSSYFSMLISQHNPLSSLEGLLIDRFKKLIGNMRSLVQIAHG